MNLPPSPDAVTANDHARNALEHHNQLVTNNLEAIEELCSWCVSQPALPGSDRCHGCQELGAGDVFSPGNVV